jgi:hypothetical protein
VALGLPLMIPAAAVKSSWAAQPDFMAASIGDASRQFALGFAWSWVPHDLDETAVGTRHHFLALNVYSCFSIEQSPASIMLGECSCGQCGYLERNSQGLGRISGRLPKMFKCFSPLSVSPISQIWLQTDGKGYSSGSYQQ